MNIKKRIAALCLAAALALSAGLSGCGTAQGDAPSNENLVPLAQSSAAALAALPFTDVASNAPCAPAVAYCLEHDILKGTSATTFAPEAITNRAMVATILYRMVGEPAITGEDSFPTPTPASGTLTPFCGHRKRTFCGAMMMDASARTTR